MSVYLKSMDTQIAGHWKLQFDTKDYFSIYIILIMNLNYTSCNKIRTLAKLLWVISFFCDIHLLPLNICNFYLRSQKWLEKKVE